MAMRVWHASRIAGIAAAAIGLSGAAALAQSSNTHILTVRLPGGGVAQIEYTGNVAPQVRIGDAPAPIAGAFAPLPSFFGPASPFAQFDRIAAEMNREAATMFARAERLTAEARSGQLTETALGGVPPGSQSYSFVSTMSGNHVCSESVEITRSGSGAPQVVRHSSGNCGAMPGAGSVDLPNAAPAIPAPGPVWTSAPAPDAAPAPIARPDVVWTRAEGATPHAGLVEPIPTAPH
jgi:hypothetical protein